MQLNPTEGERVAEVMGGLATPARVLILARLLQSPATVSELTTELGISPAAVSHHPRILPPPAPAAGDRLGRHVVYHLQDDHVRAMIEQILTHTSHDQHASPHDERADD